MLVLKVKTVRFLSYSNPQLRYHYRIIDSSRKDSKICNPLQRVVLKRSSREALIYKINIRYEVIYINIFIFNTNIHNLFSVSIEK